jgi:hypothetical protein
MEASKIIGVAFRCHDGTVVPLLRPARHFNLPPALPDGVRMTQEGQGFVDASGRFLDRETARSRALETGQCKLPRHGRLLFSEDLW